MATRWKKIRAKAKKLLWSHKIILEMEIMNVFTRFHMSALILASFYKKQETLYHVDIELRYRAILTAYWYFLSQKITPAGPRKHMYVFIYLFSFFWGGGGRGAQ